MRILITAGPTREPIDAVRYLSNRSSGKMGLALAQAASQAGHQVTLLLGPVGDVTLSAAISINRFESCEDLQKLLTEHWPSHDLLIMAAAVADYRPIVVQQGKISRDQALTLALEPTADLVKEAALNKQKNQHVVAFALEEPKVLLHRATQKMHRKGVDAIVANPLQTMDSTNISAIWITASGIQKNMQTMDKMDFARDLINLATAL
ncbi:MAG: phosphopantothenoylcysteine decarboxylase [Phycisphaeraceae bacterium]|nr:phosphopantothenoylcysteine decarboxylase [Phycisphaeraceae bacterium]